MAANLVMAKLEAGLRVSNILQECEINCYKLLFHFKYMLWGNIYFYSSIDLTTSHANNLVVKKLLYNV